jgi:signal transduction histidine kinase
MFNPKSKNNRLIFSAVVFVAALLIKFFSPINDYSGNWKKGNGGRIKEVVAAVDSAIAERERVLVSISSQIEKKIKSDTLKNLLKFLEVISTVQNNKIEINIFSNGKLLAWNNKEIISSNELYSKLKTEGKGNCFFYETPLTVYFAKISVIDSIEMFTALPVEKKYILRNPFYQKVSLADSLTNEYGLSVKINYNTQLRVGTLPIKNSMGKIIGGVKFADSGGVTVKHDIINPYNIVISLLFLFALILFLQWINKIVVKDGYLIKIGFFIFTVILIRSFIAFTGQDDFSFFGNIVNPIYYSSRKLWGFTKSPLSLFFTILALFVISLKIFFTFRQYLNTKTFSRIAKFLLFGITLITFLLLYNWFSDILKSIIFDSSILYFKDATLFGGYETVFMYFNILLVGITAVIFGVIFVEILSITILQIEILGKRNLLFLLFSVILSFLLIDEFICKKSSYVLAGFFLIVTFGIYYFQNFIRTNNYLKIFSLLITGSILSVSFLNYFNTQLEVKSLKTIANELTRSNIDLYEYYVNNAIDKVSRKKQSVSELENVKNIDALAFMLWSNTLLSTEVRSSALRIIDVDKNLLGSFEYEFALPYSWQWEDSLVTGKQLKIIDDNKSAKLIASVIPVYSGKSITKYIEIDVLYDTHKIAINSNNKLINYYALFKGIPVNTNLLKIYEYTNDTLTNYFTNVFLTKQEKEKIKNYSKHINKEDWIELNIDNDKHVFFIQKNDEQIIAVGLGEKDFMWNLFDFFKVFFIHSIMIFLFFIIVALFNYNKWKYFKISFKSKILFALLIVSIIPLIFLALYLKDISNKKNRDAVNYKLGKRADGVEHYIARHINNTDNLYEVFENANKDLGVDYAIYENENLIYSSEGTYYKIGLLPLILNPDAYLAVKKYGISEVILKENIDNYFFNSLYHKSLIKNNEYIIKVSDLLNGFRLPMSGIELNVFLFGIYSLAIIIIIIISTLLANQISAPIEKLTKATRSVSSGDMDIQLQLESGSGEVKELIAGFNLMVRQLKKNRNELAKMERESAWREMAKQVAHEIKNPLTPMKLAVQHLIAAHQDKSEKYDSIFYKVTTTIINQIDTLKNIASEFSNIAKMPELKLQPINISTIIKETANLFIEEECIIKIENDKEQIIINSDKEQFQRMIVNLIRNSIQADAKNIIIKTFSKPETVELYVIDDGKGISDNVIENIFDKEFTTKKEGMGLGLAMIRKFLNLTGGTIFVKETSDKGTTIKIEIKK